MGFSRQYWNTGVGCHFLIQEIFPTLGLNPGIPDCMQTLYRLSHQGVGGKASNLCGSAMLGKMFIIQSPDIYQLF